jgi:hypothetical protein
MANVRGGAIVPLSIEEVVPGAVAILEKLL